MRHKPTFNFDVTLNTLFLGHHLAVLGCSLVAIKPKDIAGWYKQDILAGHVFILHFKCTTPLGDLSSVCFVGCMGCIVVCSPSLYIERGCKHTTNKFPF